MRPMTISDVASKAGIRPSAIRYYERSGVLPRPARAGGRRLYDGAVLKRLAVVLLARDAGFTIREICVLLRDDSGNAALSRRQAMATRKLGDLDDMLRRTKLMRGVVQSMMTCRCNSVEECGDLIVRDRRARTMRPRVRAQAGRLPRGLAGRHQLNKRTSAAARSALASSAVNPVGRNSRT